MLRFGWRYAVSLFLSLIPVYGFSQELRDSASLSSPANRVPPHQDLVQFLGVYQPDGLFTPASTHPTISRLLKADQGEPRARTHTRPAEVPNYIDLEARERVVKNFQPRYHASEPLKAHSLFANLRDKIVLLAYGRQNVLRAPTHITTDSRQRIIISDPDLHAIHILDSAGKSAFRIEGGPRRRFGSPEGIAVDADDNIYVADGSGAAVVVFDKEGNYLRTIGIFRGESRFESPGGLAIDRKSGTLYVLDPGASELLLFDLEGKLISRVGRRSEDGVVLIHPSEIAASENKIVVLDDFGARVQTFDLQLRLLSSFRVKPRVEKPSVGEVGLSLDSAGMIYLGNLFPDKIAVFNQSGVLVSLFGHSGTSMQEFKMPSGMWIDSTDRIYVADTDNSRVQVFRPAASSDQMANMHQGASR
jgi:DNA-binding beta-propeller fold protein YncE